MSHDYTVRVTHPRYGVCELEITFDSYGSPGNGWDDPGDPPEYWIGCIWSADSTIKWFMPDGWDDSEWLKLAESGIMAILDDSDYGEEDLWIY